MLNTSKDLPFNIRIRKILKYSSIGSKIKSKNSVDSRLSIYKIAIYELGYILESLAIREKSSSIFS